MLISKRWHHISVCIRCEKKIRLIEDIQSNGVCPHCGYVSGYSMCDVKVISFKKQINIPLQFWKRETTYIGANELSNDWINANKE